MIDIYNRESLHGYLLGHGLVASGETVHYSALTGGVSCKVVKVERNGKSFVVKQALPKLNVKDDWFSDIRRILIEKDCLIALNELIPEAVPDFVHSDDEQFLYVMEAAPSEAEVWKQQLLAGRLDFQATEKIATALATVHQHSAESKRFHERFANQQIFKELRISPYLETIKEKHPSLQAMIDETIALLLEQRLTLVHGDFSPKNILVTKKRLYLLDYEVAHIGHPSFDLAFVTTHFLLKSINEKRWAPAYLHLMQAFIASYFKHIDFIDRRQLERDTVRLLAFLFLARVDGKSPAEYITAAEDKALIRELSYEIISSATTFDDVQHVMLKKRGGFYESICDY
ncbi:phosphotransferase [Alkalihalobacillus oceani]|uniref:phosphotransferase n=1 Tax=Halalkalibacter oceani TaxID=1653776 RepID=UPI00203AA759|nr:phosphotransferase [Halalkalibacter oceani]MCM3761386.1 phosphotransferase [Halalkalibacter oceani]